MRSAIILAQGQVLTLFVHLAHTVLQKQEHPYLAHQVHSALVLDYRRPTVAVNAAQVHIVVILGMLRR